MGEPYCKLISIHLYNIAKEFIDYWQISKFINENHIQYRVSIDECHDNETVYRFKNKKSLAKIRSYGVRHYKKKIA